MQVLGEEIEGVETLRDEAGLRKTPSDTRAVQPEPRRSRGDARNPRVA